ncbi:MAG: hypothetical protein HY731_02885, partial [Candidatus Tectomicrobia bacterium]|nr:hypothetical protein [Candidatus Tectomicrobia bacterium]
MKRQGASRKMFFIISLVLVVLIPFEERGAWDVIEQTLASPAVSTRPSAMRGPTEPMQRVASLLDQVTRQVESLQ